MKGSAALSAKLNKFKKSHKKKTRQTSHQFDWKREFGELKESKRKAEQVAISCLSSLLEVMGEEDEENSVSVDIISEVSGIKNDMESGVG
eukprot:CAMPEP_0118671942 /NCGR_PEP_ID=MMETSP0785-20121206/22271_1 /TAXON_ID=91992 /ORGANISM="Bolidomonas pacifica, Strain CCMP 1866" /LENGTH=89 /DNA_ID=CAMNT_0006566861 /DNA_START=217 /DNA_END=481 /DNA_ORIENTATION=-